jgi:hypothetical protein
VTESRRVKDFRLGLAKQIPRFPNDRTSRQVLQDKPLGPLLIDYANWCIRFVAPRPRAIMLESSATSDARWNALATKIEALLKKVEQGDNLTPYLSDKPRTHGFTPAASGTGANVDRWADKDMLLNVMGFHHFHFDALPMRSNDVLFAHVTRDRFTVAGIFNHTVFEFFDPAKPMAAERKRLWEIFDERATRDVPAGRPVVASMIATSGHSIYFAKLASDYARVIAEIDPKLNDSNYVRGLYENVGVPIPVKPKLLWHLHYLDLGALDKKTGAFFVLRKGPT